jgi:hypothetical protein
MDDEREQIAQEIAHLEAERDEAIRRAEEAERLLARHEAAVRLRAERPDLRGGNFDSRPFLVQTIPNTAFSPGRRT